MKYEYFEQEWADKPAWIDRAKKETIRIWQHDYKGSPTSVATRVAPGTRDFDFGMFPEIPQTDS